MFKFLRTVAEALGRAGLKAMTNGIYAVYFSFIFTLFLFPFLSSPWGSVYRFFVYIVSFDFN